MIRSRFPSLRQMLLGCLLATLASLTLTSPAQAGPIHYFTASMDGSQEVPPNGSTATGYAQFWVDADNMTIDWLLDVSGIALDQITGLHIHFAPPGVAGPVVINFSGQLSGSDLFDLDTLALIDGYSNYYVNLHTRTFPGGEIRGQLRVPTPASLWLLAGGGFTLLLARRRSKP